ncbi:MAG TPA: protein kinase, partial [Kofleriaceae bacterium]|nr:protein kinase [Kofleriaceae bacterium]
MEQLGKYQLVRRIGTGGMAEVFLARTTLAQGLAKQLVIKKIHPAFARSRQFVSMFIDEAKIALGLNHPNIVQVFDFGPAADTYFLAMEYVEGVDLLHLGQLAAEQGRQLPLGLAVYVIQQLCKGLDYAHRKTDDYGEPLGIVHRDISQQNILVSWDGSVKIVDFGIARARGVHEEEGVIKGKFAYMSPEQARGDLVDSRSDVYSAGVVLFELLCNRPLYSGKGKDLLEKVKAGALPRPSYINAAIPKELEAVILKALTFHRDDRYQTARDMQYALSKVQLAMAHDTGTLLDSAALAQFVAQVVPAEQRRPPPLPPSAEGTPASLRLRDGDTGSSLDDTDARRPAPAATTPPPTARERKHVYVLEGSICGLPNLERRVGADRAAAMVDDYLGVAKNVGFKHDAHLHRIDEAGLTFVVGLPMAAEDDASRAIRLALALVDALDGIGHDVEPELRLAVGIQSGMATLKRDAGKLAYDLSPATTAIARRLSREAQGAEVLVGGRVFRVAKGDFTFEELTTIDVPADPDTQPGAPEEAARARVYRL